MLFGRAIAGQREKVLLQLHFGAAREERDYAEIARFTPTKTDACTACSRCDRRCPFQVAQSKRMAEIAACFAGK